MIVNRKFSTVLLLETFHALARFIDLDSAMELTGAQCRIWYRESSSYVHIVLRRSLKPRVLGGQRLSNRGRVTIATVVSRLTPGEYSDATCA